MSFRLSFEHLTRPRALTAYGVTVLLIAAFPAAAQSEFESPPTFKASEILPLQLLKGPNHKVDEVVRNDGYLNRYTIKSKYGEFAGVTTAKFRKRIREIDALSAMEKARATKIFRDSAMEAAGDVWRGMKMFVTKPVDTLTGAVSGVGKIFMRVGEHLFGSKRSDTEDNRLKAIIGFSKTKREYAYDFGVDVYSTNKVLQDKLNDTAWAGYVGGISVAAVMSAVPGGAGVFVSTAGGSRLMNEVFRTTAPVDLRRLNRERLDKMGINADIAELFIDNSVLTPRQQTLLVIALESMNGVKNREVFVKFAILTKDQDVAFFRQRMAQMYAAYHKTIAPIDRFVVLGGEVPIRNLGIARTADGKIIFHAPLDYLVWTELIARIFEAMNNVVDGMPSVSAKELWLAGTVSPIARRKIHAAGWVIHDKMEARLLPSDWCSAKDVSECDKALVYGKGKGG